MKTLKISLIAITVILAIVFLALNCTQTSNACTDSTKVYSQVENLIHKENFRTLNISAVDAYVKVKFKINEKGKIQFTEVNTNNASVGIEIIKKLRGMSFTPDQALAKKIFKIEFLF